MALFICRNCLSVPNENGVSVPGLHFDAEHPVCPNCGIDGREVEYSQYVGKCPYVHFDPPHHVLRDKGVGKTACDGRKVGAWEGDHPIMLSGDREAVTCPKCKQTDVFRSDVRVGASLHAKE